MNNIKFEIRQNLRAMIITVLVVSVVLFMYVSLYESFLLAIDSFSKALESLPEAMKVAFGLDPSLLTSFSGYYSFTLSIISLVIGFFAVNTATKIYGFEKSNDLLEYVLVKPVSKFKLYANKYVAGLVTVLIFNVIYNIIFFIMTIVFVNDYDLTLLIELNIYALLLSLSLFSIASIFVNLLKNIKQPVVINFAILMVFYSLNIVNGIVDEEALNLITPFSMFKYSDIISSGINVDSIIYLVVVLVISFLIGAIKYSKLEVQSWVYLPTNLEVV